MSFITVFQTLSERRFCLLQFSFEEHVSQISSNKSVNISKIKEAINISISFVIVTGRKCVYCTAVRVLHGMHDWGHACRLGADGGLVLLGLRQKHCLV
jgi:hypothetical protein